MMDIARGAKAGKATVYSLGAKMRIAMGAMATRKIENEAKNDSIGSVTLRTLS